MAKKQKKPANGGNIAQNKRARHDYLLEQKFEAGVVLTGWEVKSLREGKVQLVDSYVHMQNGEAWLLGCQITPLNTASTHVIAEPRRNRKLLLNQRELAKIHAETTQKGLTCVCTSLYWKGHLIKAEIALARGKKEHDKRNTEKDRDWNRQKQRIMRK